MGGVDNRMIGVLLTLSVIIIVGVLLFSVYEWWAEEMEKNK